MSALNRLFNVIDKSLFTICGKLDYARITDAITRLADTVQDTETDESTWAIGEFGACTLGDLIVGAYWHYTEWHSGQFSDGYAALCALGAVFSPGMGGPEEDNEVYQALNALAAKDTGDDMPA